MIARWITADVFDGLATLETGSVDLVVTSPPFLALRSYLPADHPDKGKEIGSEATPAEFIDVLLRVTEELRRVLAPHGSICIELGDTYAGSGGAGGDYDAEGLRAGQPKFRQQPPNTAHRLHADGSLKTDSSTRVREAKNVGHLTPLAAGHGWPLAKSRALIPELYRIALAYGFNPLTGSESPAGKWRVRNNVTWCRPNPPVGALGDKWRPATSDLVVACVSDKRYWDDLATRKPLAAKTLTVSNGLQPSAKNSESPTASHRMDRLNDEQRGAPLLDYWEIPPTGYTGSHYAAFPPALVEPCVKAMAPPKVCRECGEPPRRIVDVAQLDTGRTTNGPQSIDRKHIEGGSAGFATRTVSERTDAGWTTCGHDDYRPGLILDPFAGSGTTLLVATGYGHDAIGIDLDSRNADLARERVGPFMFELSEPAYTKEPQ